MGFVTGFSRKVELEPRLGKERVRKVGERLKIPGLKRSLSRWYASSIIRSFWIPRTLAKPDIVVYICNLGAAIMSWEVETGES